MTEIGSSMQTTVQVVLRILRFYYSESDSNRTFYETIHTVLESIYFQIPLLHSNFKYVRVTRACFPSTEFICQSSELPITRLIGSNELKRNYKWELLQPLCLFAIDFECNRCHVGKWGGIWSLDGVVMAYFALFSTRLLVRFHLA